MNNVFCCEVVKGKGAIALLALRFVAGYAFILHGWPKFQHATTWMGDVLPGWLQFLAAFAEFAGGAAILVGLFTPLAASGIAVTMLVAMFMVHIPKGDPFVGNKENPSSWELAAVYFSIMFVLMLRGAGSLSLDALIFKKNNRA